MFFSENASRKVSLIVNFCFIVQLGSQLTVDGVTLETGQNVPLNVEEEIKPEVEPAQILLLQTEELTVKATVLKAENAIFRNAQVFLSRNTNRNTNNKPFGCLLTNVLFSGIS